MEYTSNSDKITREYFDSLLLETRYLDSEIPSTKMELFGESFDTPVMTAALSHLGNTAPNGMIIYAEAAKKANAVHWVGMGEDKELEDIVATGARTIKIIKPLEDDGKWLVKMIYNGDIFEILHKTGNIPLPPYIERKMKDDELKKLDFEKNLTLLNESK